VLAQAQPLASFHSISPLGGACQQHDGHEHALLGELLA
jgi:hypothetical protein